jgi:acetyl-CoA C-acetyltransferase
MTDAVIVGACRTAIGNLGGALSALRAPALGAAALAEAIRRAGVKPDQVQEVVMGQVLQAGIGQHPARQAALAAGLPVSVSACSVNKMCGSGLLAVGLAARAVQTGEVEVAAAGGMESMSQAPFLLDQARTGYRLGHGTLRDSLIHDGLWDAAGDCHMGRTAEHLAQTYGISRADQDAYAVQSQARCAAALAKGLFAEEITPVSVPQRRGEPVLVREDEFPRPDTTLDKLAKLKPAFQKDGTVTAGNASGINDGAAALVLASAAAARRFGLAPLARVRAWATAGLEAANMGLGPVPAARLALSRAGLTLADMDLIEINEAFAAQILAVKKELAWDDARVNVNGGALALGHPIGASGARILVTLLYEMKRRQARLGLAALCIGGGEGIAMVVERTA